jgi:26S proteasome regulatory subunit N7
MKSFFKLFILSQIIKGSEILEVLHSLPEVKEYLFSLYNCQYAEFFINLGLFES